MGWEYSEKEVDNTGMMAAGTYLAECTSAELKRSYVGDEMVNVTLVEAGSRKHLCFDNLMMEGKGRNIGAKKALGLGVGNREDGRVVIYDVERWKGSRCVLTIAEDTWKGRDGTERKQMKPSFQSEGFGYMLEETWEGVQAETANAPEDDSDIPF